MCLFSRFRSGQYVPLVFALAILNPLAKHHGLAAAQDDGLATARALENTFVGVIERTQKSVVAIARLKKVERFHLRPALDPFRREFRQGRQSPLLDDPDNPDFVPVDFGAGVIIAPEDRPHERYILTNYHVVKGGPATNLPVGEQNVALFARFADHHSGSVAIKAADPRSDLAVLEIDFSELGIKQDDLEPMIFAGQPDFRKGRIVLALGNPYAIARDGSASASWGMISNRGRRPAMANPLNEMAFRRQTMHHFGTLLQIDSRLDLGTSGGAVVNLDGELIGISTALAALEGYEKSVGYAVPVDSATRRIVDSLTRGLEVEYGFLGVRPDDVLPREMLRLSGSFEQPSAARVLDVYPGSPAAKGRLLSGDVVLQVNNQPVYGQYDLMRHVGQLGPAATAHLAVWREKASRELNLEVKLGKWPVHDDEGIIATENRYDPWRGLTIDYPTARAKFLQYPLRYHPAVLVTRIDPGLKENTEVREGDLITHVNDSAVRTPAEFHRAVRELSGDVRLVVIGREPVVMRE